MAASFQVAEAGLEHQFESPDVPGPEDLGLETEMPEQELEHLPQKLRRWLDRFGPWEFRMVRGHNPLERVPKPPFQEFWFRLNGDPGDDPLMNRALLAYLSDFHLIGTATLPHGISWIQEDLVMASLDHAMWFHREFKLDDWFLYVCDSPQYQWGQGTGQGHDLRPPGQADCKHGARRSDPLASGNQTGGELIMSEKTASFAAGCFWGVEARFREISGVIDAAVGYMGGETDNPGYQQVCTGNTRHAESVQLLFDDTRVSYAELLDAFFALHNPTTLDRQGPDFGNQYRSAVFWHDAEQREKLKKRLPNSMLPVNGRIP